MYIYIHKNTHVSKHFLIQFNIFILNQYIYIQVRAKYLLHHFSSDSIIQSVVALYPVLLLNRDNPSNSCDNTRSVNILAHTHACTSLFPVIRSIKVSYMVFPPWLAYLLLCPAVEGGCWYMGGSDDYTNQLGQSR